MNIVHLKREEIDIKKWDECIYQAFNGNVYAFSWYLDIVCECWEALIVDDYQIVMPLTTNKKYGFHYLYQPFFTQQLGVFSQDMLTPSITMDVINSIPSKYKFAEINLNTYNKIEGSSFKSNDNVNYELDLINPYDDIAAKYATNIKRNIKKAINNNVSLINGCSPNDLITLFKKEIGRNTPLKESDYSTIRKIMATAIRFKSGSIWGAYSKNNELCAAAFFLSGKNKSIFLFSASNKLGKEIGAMPFLIDSYIKQNSEQNNTLDFEGSNISGLARFYSGFGATACKYLSIKRNNLPFLLRLIKR